MPAIAVIAVIAVVAVVETSDTIPTTDAQQSHPHGAATAPGQGTAAGVYPGGTTAGGW
jgi:hypothetical protein